jgi:precorrin-8X/cobalt-precorrin-8 methylmutase
MGALFDRYVVADWSSAGRPSTGADSIWIAELGATGGPELSNPPTRALAASTFARAAAEGRRTGDRTLLAVDAPLGYPAGAAAHFGLTPPGEGTAPWRAMWTHTSCTLHDDERNANDRFEVAAGLNRSGGSVGPFWGRPHQRTIEGLAATKPGVFVVPELRHCEHWLRAQGLRPASCWQLAGVGSVGSQTLTLLPVLERLLTSGGSDVTVEVWPFTTGWSVPRPTPGSIVLAETWPTAFDVTYPIHWIRDAAQVHDVALELRRADEAGELAGWFAPDVPEAVTAAAVQEEGWALIPPRSTEVSGDAGAADQQARRT